MANSQGVNREGNLKKDPTMRALILTAILAIAALPTSAQFSKGDKSIGGSVGVFVQKTPKSTVDGYESRYTSFSIQPHFRYLITEKLAVGGSIGYSTSRQRWSQANFSENTSHSNGYHIGLSIRRFATLAEGFLFSIGAETTYSDGYFKDSNSPEEVRYYSYGIGASPSFHFFPTKNFAIEGGIGNIGFSRSIQENIDRKTNQFSLSLGYLNFGLAYYFRQ
jgi:hypothetical protein